MYILGLKCDLLKKFYSVCIKTIPFGISHSDCVEKKIPLKE